MDIHSGSSCSIVTIVIFLSFVKFCVIFVLFKAEKARTLSASKDKAGAKVSDKKGKNPPSPGGLSKEKRTKLKRRDDVEPPKFIGNN